MAETVIVTPDQVELRPGTRGYVKDLMVMHIREGAPYITFIESAPNHYAQIHSHSVDEVMVVVTEIDRQGRVNLSRKAAMQRHLAK